MSEILCREIRKLHEFKNQPIRANSWLMLFVSFAFPNGHDLNRSPFPPWNCLE